MRRDRVAEDIYTFTSELYAQVTAGVILTSEGTVVIDTLPFPQETQEMLAFVRDHGQGTVRYVINTHYHSDHTNGTYMFAGAEVIAHKWCHHMLSHYGRRSLAEAKRETAALSDVQIHLPSIVIESDAYIHLGDRSLYLTPLPGHTRDSIGVMIEGDRILFAGDAVLPVPYIVWGDAANSINSLRTVRTLRPESVVQGHGDLLLRGELGDEIESSVHYIEALVEKVQYLVDQRAPQSAVAGIDIESCGKSRVPLDGLVQHLHRENAIAVYHRLKGKPESLETQPLF